MRCTRFLRVFMNYLFPPLLSGGGRQWVETLRDTRSWHRDCFPDRKQILTSKKGERSSRTWSKNRKCEKNKTASKDFLIFEVPVTSPLAETTSTVSSRQVCFGSFTCCVWTIDTGKTSNKYGLFLSCGGSKQSVMRLGSTDTCSAAAVPDCWTVL